MSREVKPVKLSGSTKLPSTLELTLYCAAASRDISTTLAENDALLSSTACYLAPSLILNLVKLKFAMRGRGSDFRKLECELGTVTLAMKMRSPVAGLHVLLAAAPVDWRTRSSSTQLMS